MIENPERSPQDGLSLSLSLSQALLL